MEIVVILALVIPLIIGLLLGMMRGSRRATLRILLVILCLVLAFCFKDAVTVLVMDYEIESGVTVSDWIMAQLPAEYAELGAAVLMPIATLLVSAFVFLLLFFVIKFITWLIVYPICKIFVKKARKKKDGSYGNKHGLIGGVVGLAQGAVVGLVLCIILHGVFLNLANVAEAVNGMADDNQGGDNAMVMMADESDDGSSGVGGGDGLGGMLGDTDPLKLLADYKASGICNTISNTGGNKLFDLAVSMKTEDGRKLTLTGQIDALTGLVNIAKELSSLQNVDMVGGLSGDLATEISNIFNNLDEINKNLSDESKETMTEIVQIVAGGLLPEDMVRVLDFTKISFANEGQVLTELNSYKDTDVEDITPELAEKIVDTVMKSDIILPLLSSNDQFTIGLNDEQKAFAKDVIDGLASKDDTDKDKIEMLKKFFGLNESSQQQPQPEQPEQPQPEQPEQPQPEQPEQPEQPAEPEQPAVA